MSREDRRKARQEKRAAADIVIPPEGVPIRLPVAGVGVRVAAQVADVLITSVTAIAIVVFLFTTGIARPTAASAVFVLLFFLIRIPYYVLAEIAWNGQTLGKKWMKIKVVSHDAGPLRTHALVLRNIMKEAEVFLPGTLLFALDESDPITSLLCLAWVAMALAIPSLDSRRRRLGDMMAGTHVVHLPQPILLQDISTQVAPKPRTKSEAYHFLAHQLDHYGAFELQTLEGVLRSASEPGAGDRTRKTLLAIVDKVRAKISYADPVPNDEAQAFLRAFYNAQRAHLEQRQLFGDKRADKHHARAEEGTDEAAGPQV